MEDKIEVHEYVRFNNGEIGKVIDIKENPSRIVYSEYGEIGLISDIVKHSKNIIDLIEVGDYVNGKKVIMDLKQSKEWYKAKDDFVTCKDYTFSNEEIVTILTKEIYMDNCYKVGGEDE